MDPKTMRFLLGQSETGHLYDLPVGTYFEHNNEVYLKTDGIYNSVLIASKIRPDKVGIVGVIDSTTIVKICNPLSITYSDDTSDLQSERHTWEFISRFEGEHVARITAASYEAALDVAKQDFELFISENLLEVDNLKTHSLASIRLVK